jgi:hypothetical protein
MNWKGCERKRMLSSLRSPRIFPEGVKILSWAYRKNEEVLGDRTVQSDTHPKGGGGRAAGLQPRSPQTEI